MRTKRALRNVTTALAVLCLMVSLTGCASDPSCAQTPGTRARVAMKPGDPGMVVARQTLASHGRIAWLLRSLRSTQRRSYETDDTLWAELESTTSKVLYPERRGGRVFSDQDKRIVEQLSAQVDVSFARTPIESVVASLHEKTGINCLLISRDVPPDGAPVTLEFKGSMRDALDHIGTLAELSWDVDDGAVRIGAAEALADYDVRIYPVRDLLIPVEALQSGKPIEIDERDLKERAEALLELIRRACAQAP